MSMTVPPLGIFDELSAARDVATLMRLATERLRAAGVPSPVADAEILIGLVLNGTRGQVQAWVISGREVSSYEAAQIAAFVLRRAGREPLQYITGVAAFRGIELSVGPGVFIPRPETETLVDAALDLLPMGGRILDLGTGSGAIALSVASERPDSEVVAVEASAVAFTWAKQNLRHLALGNVHIVHGDFADPSTYATIEGGPVDVVVTNPPYVPSWAIPRDPEVWLHDPELALYSGQDGLDAIRQIAAVARPLVNPGGSLLIEHGEDQGESVREVLSSAGWQNPQTAADLTGRDRVTSARR